MKHELIQRLEHSLGDRGETMSTDLRIVLVLLCEQSLDRQNRIGQVLLKSMLKMQV